MADAAVNDPFRPAGLPHPSPEAVVHGRQAAHLIRRRIEAQGSIPFSDYMELCLNAPGLGYYTAGSAKFGPEGDFVTAPEISPLFGRSVARQIESVLNRLGGGEILELGGGTGAFAESCLAELSRRGANPRRYRILETSPDLRDRQRRRLGTFGVEWLDTIPEEPFDGVVFANEVVDAPARRALPAHPGEGGIAARRHRCRRIPLGSAAGAARPPRPCSRRREPARPRARAGRLRVGVVSLAPGMARRGHPPPSPGGYCSYSTTATGKQSTIIRTAAKAPSDATTDTAGTTIPSSFPPFRTSPRAWTSAPSRGPGMRQEWTV